MLLKKCLKKKRFISKKPSVEVRNKIIRKHFEAIVIGASAGGMKALNAILSVLPANFPSPIIIVQHLHPHSDNHLAKILNSKCRLTVKQADEKEEIKNGIVYTAPPNYHLLIEENKTFSLSIDTQVNFSRPAIDVLFETAIYAYRNRLIGIILTGANNDGSVGIKKIKQVGGYVIVQDPKTAETPIMPEATLAITPVDKILPVEQIGDYLTYLVSCQDRKGV